MKTRNKLDTDDFLSLERHLSELHRSGQRLWKVKRGNRLSFCPCPPEDYMYRLDFIPKGLLRADYLVQVNEAGWRHCGQIAGWQCLRKPAGPTEEADLAKERFLHSDLERAAWGRKRAEQTALLGCLPLVACYCLGSLFNHTSYANLIWTLAVFALLAAVAVVLPAYQTRIQCGKILSRIQQEQTSPRTDVQCTAPSKDT